MSQALLVLTDRGERDRAIRWIDKAPAGTRVVFQAAQRSTDQNSKLWAMLSEVASQCPWHGVKLTAEDWKFVFLDALKRELRMVPNLEGNGFVNIGRSSSNLSKSEMSDLIELIHAFGAQHGVTFHDEDSSPAIASSPTPAETDTPASETPAPRSSDAGTPIQESSSVEHADDGSTGDDERAAPDTSSPVADPALPQGWQITYAAALRRAQKKESLSKYAAEYWKQYGGWNAHKDGSDAITAKAIYDAFANNFGRKDVIESELRELI